MAFLPVNINLSGKKILMVGGGKVALHKLKNLARYHPDLTVIAPSIHPNIIEMGYTCHEREYREGDLKGFHLVYACTNQSDLNHKIKQDADKTGSLVNVADDAAHCDFISPAIYKTGDFSVSISSGGTDVKKAVRWRDQIKTIIEQDSAWN